MEIKSEIINSFMGEINGVKFDKEDVFYTSEFVLYEMVGLGIKVDEKIITMLGKALKEIMHYGENAVDLAEMEQELYSSLNNYGTLETYFDSNDALMELNDYLEEIKGE